MPLCCSHRLRVITMQALSTFRALGPPRRAGYTDQENVISSAELQCSHKRPEVRT